MKRKIRNLPLFLSGAVLICLIVPPYARGLAAGAAAVAVLFLVLQRCQPQSVPQVIRNAGRTDRILAILFWLFLAAIFVYKWKPSSKVAAAASLVHLSGTALLVVCAVCSVISIPFLFFILERIPTADDKLPPGGSEACTEDLSEGWRGGAATSDHSSRHYYPLLQEFAAVSAE